MLISYIKGVPQKLHALDVFLSEHPEWIGKVVLVQVAVRKHPDILPHFFQLNTIPNPLTHKNGKSASRQDVEEYQNLRSNVNELVGRINGRFGTVEYMPIHFMHRSVTFDELCALYAISDACLVTSPRDGMNLVSHFTALEVSSFSMNPVKETMWSTIASHVILTLRLDSG